NQLASLPESIGQLSKLRKLYLHNNQLIKLPKSLLRLTQLEELGLHENNALSLPMEVLAHETAFGKLSPAEPAKILEYYFRARRPLNEAKLILVGRGGVGKTSIVNRLVHETFKDEKKTEGIRITEWRL